MAGVAVRSDVIEHISRYLSQGKRIEIEALHGSVVRRAAATQVAVPIMSTLYALLKPFAEGQPQLG